MICWEASDQRRDMKRHSNSEWRFVLWLHLNIGTVLFGSVLSYAGTALRELLPTCKGARLPVVSKLPIQAADANHPIWAEKARR
jgi:hypothetical protein